MAPQSTRDIDKLSSIFDQLRVTVSRRVGPSPPMARVKTGKKGKEEEEKVERVTIFLYFYASYRSRLLGSNSSTRSRWRVLPPEITRMILQFLKADMVTRCACSRVAREFYYVVISCLGRHLRVNTVSRLKGCLKLVAGRRVSSGRPLS